MKHKPGGYLHTSRGESAFLATVKKQTYDTIVALLFRGAYYYADYFDVLQ